MAIRGINHIAALVAVVCLLGLMGHSSEAATGRATYYTTYVPSACYGDDTSVISANNNFIVAANSGLYNGGAACGQICQVSCYGDGCTTGSIISVKIVDLCSGCASDQLDLSQEAFSSIANTGQGAISINYSCS